MLIAAAMTDVLDSSVGRILVVVFFSSFLFLSVTVLAFGTRNENHRSQGLDKD